MSSRTARVLTFAVTGSVILLLILGAIGLSASELGWAISRVFLWALALVFLGVGGLVAIRQPRNAIGWLFLFVAVASALAEAAYGYAEYWLSNGGSAGLGRAAAAYSNVSWIPFTLVPATFLLLLFPHGHLLSRRWKPIAWSSALGITGAFITTALMPGPLEDFPGLTNPYGWDSPALDALTALSFLALFVGMLGSSASLIVRFRAAHGELRQQMKWLAFAGAVVAITFPLGLLVYDVWDGALSNVAIMLSVLGLPVSAGIAILRYRLYDVDRFVNRTIVYGALTALLAIIYLGTVFALQELLGPITKESDIAVAASTLAVAGMFGPLRGRVQSFIDRRFYRRKYDAAATLGAFSSRLRDQVDLDSLGRELVAVVGTTMQPAHASLWLRGEAEAAP